MARLETLVAKETVYNTFVHASIDEVALEVENIKQHISALFVQSLLNP